MEDIEYHDWGIDNSMSNQERRQKSISAYYLNRWYPLVKELTFDTVMYPIVGSLEEACPTVLPFSRSMVRYENKSPKDSEHWGPVRTKEDVLRLFNTSLRCLTNKGRFLCFRKWQDGMGAEFRCFWNSRLVAVGIEDFAEKELDHDVCVQVIAYIDQISGKIPYYRCIFDIALINGEFKLIEFNSWETNSGAFPFDWKDDTDILYSDGQQIVFRHGQYQKEFNRQVTVERSLNSNFDRSQLLHVLKPKKPSNWLVTDKYIYVTTDIWLARFSVDLSNADRWRRGVYRFNCIEPCLGGCLKIGNEYLYDDLSPCRSTPEIDHEYFAPEYPEYPENPKQRYGFYCVYQDQIRFCRLENTGNLVLL